MTLRNNPMQSSRRGGYPKVKIRSPAFRKKFDEGMPRINQKAIQFHNFYDIEISNIEIAKEHGLKFWGCILPEKAKRVQMQKLSSSSQKRHIQTRGQTIFKRYMRRRPSLTLTPRGPDPEEDQHRFQQTVSEFRPYKHDSHANPQHKSSERREDRERQKETIESFMVTDGQIAAINNKSLYEMTPRELQLSIEWKKRFLELFHQKMEKKQKIEFSFKPYRS